jgi:hypothetical protein
VSRTRHFLISAEEMITTNCKKEELFPSSISLKALLIDLSITIIVVN